MMDSRPKAESVFPAHAGMNLRRIGLPLLVVALLALGVGASAAAGRAEVAPDDVVGQSAPKLVPHSTLPGAGALPWTVGTLGPAAPPPDELPEDPVAEDEPPVSRSCWANGSLLAKRLKDASWPSCTVVAGAAASEPVESVAGPGC